MNPQARQPELKNDNNKVEASAGEVSISGWLTGCRGTRMEGGDELFRAAFAGAKGAGLQFAGHATPHTTPRQVMSRSGMTRSPQTHATISHTKHITTPDLDFSHTTHHAKLYCRVMESQVHHYRVPQNTTQCTMLHTHPITSKPRFYHTAPRTTHNVTMYKFRHRRIFSLHVMPNHTRTPPLPPLYTLSLPVPRHIPDPIYPRHTTTL